MERAEGYGLVLDTLLSQGVLTDSRYLGQEEANILLSISTSDLDLTEEARLLRKQHLVIQCCRIRREYGDEIEAGLIENANNWKQPKLPYHLVPEDVKATVRAARGRSMSWVRRKTGLSERTIQKIWYGEV